MRILIIIAHLEKSVKQRGGIGNELSHRLSILSEFLTQGLQLNFIILCAKAKAQFRYSLAKAKAQFSYSLLYCS